MKLPVAALATLAALVAIVPASSQPSEATSSTTVPPVSAFLPLGGFGPRQLVFFGFVKSVTPTGSRYVMRADPALVLTGVTATTAAVEDKVLRPGEPVPNDYYIRDEAHRLLTYRVPATAHVTVLTNPGTGPRSTTVTVFEFSQIVKGKNPARRPGLWGPASGFWIRIEADKALTINQAYRP